MGGIGLTAEGQDGCMLKEQEPIADGSVCALGNEALLERESVPIPHASEP
jgi:hypothetical protein